jgi:predicted nucleic acid-binding protein
MIKYLVDTTMLVDMLRGNVAAKKFLENRPEISMVTVAELIQGALDKQNLKIVEKTCKLLPQIEIDRIVSLKAIDLLRKYSLSHGLLFMDALIAASAISKKCVLVTANVKDFIFIEDLKVESQKKILDL